MTSKRRNQRRSRRPRTVNRRLQGAINKGPFDPPATCSNPWNQVVLVSRGVTTKDPSAITSSSLFILLKSQLGLEGITGQLSMRIRRCGMWLDTSQQGGTADLGISAYSLTWFYGMTSARARAWIEDVGTLVRPAHCHYVWPDTDQQVILNSGDQVKNVLAYDASAANIPFTVHFHILWRATDVDLVPTFRKYPTLSETVSITPRTSFASLVYEDKPPDAAISRTSTSNENASLDDTFVEVKPPIL